MRRAGSLAIIAVVVAIVLAGCTPPADNRQTGALVAAPQSEGTSRTITVGGVGTTRVTPDVAFVTLGVQTRGQTAAEAQAANATTMTNVLNAIKAQGIPESAIQTRGLVLSPIVETEGQVTGYQAENHVVVRVTDLSRVGPLIDAAVGAGANAAGGVRFGLADESAAKQQALEAAANDARAKADAIAKALGVQISAVESVAEESSAQPSPLDAVEAAPRAAAAPDTPVEPGELTVTVRLRVVYAY